MSLSALTTAGLDVDALERAAAAPRLGRSFALPVALVVHAPGGETKTVQR